MNPLLFHESDALMVDLGLCIDWVNFAASIKLLKDSEKNLVLIPVHPAVLWGFVAFPELQ